jgi:ATP-dependent helicase HrpA
LRSEFAAKIQQSFRELATRDAPAATDGVAGLAQISDWDFGALAPVQEVRRGAQVLIGYPALVDQGTHCTLEVFDDPELARNAHRGGLRRLFRLQLRQQIQALEKSQLPLAALQMRARAIPAMAQLEPLAEQIVTAALDRVCLAEPWPQDREQFLARREVSRGRLSLVAQEIGRLVNQIVEEAAIVHRKLGALRGVDATRDEMTQQLARLLGRRFVVDTPAESLPHLPRYLKGIALRLDKLKTDPARDQARAREIGPLQTRWIREVAARKGVADERLEEFRWLLEELRVSLFAQELRTPQPVSVKRLEKFWASVQR